jgi:hypothetical protein
MKKDLGTTKAGLPILARCCGEDNSGHLVYQPEASQFVVHFSYPIGEEIDGSLVYTSHFSTKEEAVQALRWGCGWDEHGPII